MTTAELVGYIRRYHYFADKRISISPDLVYLAGTWAQNDILSDLRLLEKFINLTLVVGQERYQFDPQTVTAATTASPIVLTITGHPFNTGDSAFVSGGVGLSGMNGFWPAVTKVDANKISLDDSTGTGTWSSGGTVYHGLAAAADIRLVSRKESPWGVIGRKPIETAENERSEFESTNSPSSEVNSHYVIYDDPLIIGFRGKPDSALKTEILIHRKPLPSDALSASVNPIVPAQYDKLLFRATVYQALDLLDLQDAADAVGVAWEKYQVERDRVRSFIASTQRAKKNNTDSFKW